MTKHCNSWLLLFAWTWPYCWHGLDMAQRSPLKARIVKEDTHCHQLDHHGVEIDRFLCRQRDRRRSAAHFHPGSSGSCPDACHAAICFPGATSGLAHAPSLHHCASALCLAFARLVYPLCKKSVSELHKALTVHFGSSITTCKEYGCIRQRFIYKFALVQHAVEMRVGQIEPVLCVFNGLTVDAAHDCSYAMQALALTAPCHYPAILLWYVTLRLRRSWLQLVTCNTQLSSVLSRLTSECRH